MCRLRTVSRYLFYMVASTSSSSFFLFVLFAAAFRILRVTANDDDSPLLLLIFSFTLLLFIHTDRNSSGRCFDTLAQTHTPLTAKQTHHEHRNSQTSRGIFDSHNVDCSPGDLPRVCCFQSHRVRYVMLMRHVNFDVSVYRYSADGKIAYERRLPCEWHETMKLKRICALNGNWVPDSWDCSLLLSSRDHHLTRKCPTTDTYSYPKIVHSDPWALENILHSFAPWRSSEPDSFKQ